MSLNFKFRLVESLIIEDGEISAEIHLYRDKNGKAYIFDGTRLVEVSTQEVGAEQRRREGREDAMPIGGSEGENQDDSDDGDDDSSDGSGGGKSDEDDNDENQKDGSGEGDEDSDDEGDAEDGKSDKSDKNFDKKSKSDEKKDSQAGKSGTGVDPDEYEDINLDSISLSKEENDSIFRQILHQQVNTKARQVAQAEKAKKSLNATAADVVAEEITTNIKQLLSSQIKNKDIIDRRWADDRNDDTGEKATLVDYDDELERRNKPLCHLYIDASGSCDNATSQAVIKTVRNTFLSFTDEDPDKSKIDFIEYYFADRVAKTSAAAGGGTSWAPLKAHISGVPIAEDGDRYRKPDNVVIITDSDLAGQHHGEVVKLSGAAWAMFVERADKELCNPNVSSDLWAPHMMARTFKLKDGEIKREKNGN